MKKLLFVSLPLICLLFSCSPSVITVSTHEMREFDQFASMSMQTNKPIMLWVPISVDDINRHFATTRKTSRNLYENFLIIRSSNAQFSGQLREIYRLPDDVSTLLILRDSTQIIDMIVPGYLPGREKISLDSIANRALRIYNNLSDWEENAIDGTLNRRDWLTLLEVLRLNLNTMEMEQAISDFRVTLTEDDLNDPVVWEFILLYNLSMDNSIVQTIKNDPALVENPDSVFPWLDWIEGIYFFNMPSIINSNDSLMLENLISLENALGPDSIKNPNFAFEARLLFCRETSRDEAYKILLRTRAQEEENFDFFFNEVMALLNNQKMKENKEMAKELASIGLKRNPDDPDYLLLNAFVLMETDNEKDAVKMAYRAYQKAKTDTQSEQAELFLLQLLGPEWYYYSP